MLKKRYSIFLSVLLVIMLLSTYGAIAEAKEKVNLRIASGSSTSSSTAFSVALTALCEKHTDWIRGEALPVKAYGEGVYFLLSDKANMAISTEVQLDQARRGLPPYGTLGKETEIQILANTPAVYMHVVVREDSDIKALTYEQLKGKTIVTREHGSIGEFVSIAYLKALGIDLKKDVKMLYAGSTDACNYLNDGTVDIFMVIYGPPSSALAELFHTKPYRLLAIPEELTKKVKQGLKPAILRGGLYQNQGPVQSAVIYSWWLVKKDFDPDVSYELMKLWWEHTEERDVMHPNIRDYGTKEHFLDSLDSTDAKIHEGALKYYREKGWIK